MLMHMEAHTKADTDYYAELMPQRQNEKNGKTSHYSDLGAFTYYFELVTAIPSLVVRPKICI